MIRYRAGTKSIRAPAQKKYVIAVLIGVLLGGSYAVAEPPLGSPAQVPLSKAALAHSSHTAKSPRVGDDCAYEPVGIVVALTVFVSGREAGRYPEFSPAHISGPVCTWAI